VDGGGTGSLSLRSTMVRGAGFAVQPALAVNPDRRTARLISHSSARCDTEATTPQFYWTPEDSEVGTAVLRPDGNGLVSILGASFELQPQTADRQVVKRAAKKNRRRI